MLVVSSLLLCCVSTSLGMLQYGGPFAYSRPTNYIRGQGLTPGYRPVRNHGYGPQGGYGQLQNQVNYGYSQQHVTGQVMVQNQMLNAGTNQNQMYYVAQPAPVAPVAPVETSVPELSFLASLPGPVQFSGTVGPSGLPGTNVIDGNVDGPILLGGFVQGQGPFVATLEGPNDEDIPFAGNVGLQSVDGARFLNGNLQGPISLDGSFLGMPGLGAFTGETPGPISFSGNLFDQEVNGNRFISGAVQGPIRFDGLNAAQGPFIALVPGNLPFNGFVGSNPNQPQEFSGSVLGPLFAGGQIVRP